MSRERRAVLAAAGASAVLATVFGLAELGGVAAAIVAALLLVLVPVVALVQEIPPLDEIRAHRTGFYAASIVFLAVAGLLTLAVAPELRHASGLLRTWPSSPGALLLPAALLTAGGLLVVYAFRGLSARFGWQETGVVRAIMPVTGREKGVFALLSLAAGVFEELVFRGFLPLFLMPWTGSYLGGALPVAVVFGFLHAYQGRHGIARTALMGGILAVGVVWTGSLWPSIFAHAALDLILGLVLAKSILGEPPAVPAREGA
ncbi:MAG: CPBP family intramembrane metalloprotease [Gemmatimonadetes bacterium]|nr:CPBP family intramembrane metalloprotease [Gemmatimonadota bacterium]MYH53391.1 CPBP family intramembrane metalloprotease [Gemmatimonadota bacterium]MYK65188.1 CPBP family intramembrane metalloprotease [Gemmatimonadota bacterium]